MTDQNLIVRRARKEWACQAKTHHVDCPGTILRGNQYVEYIGEAHAYSSGTRYSPLCAAEAWGEDAFTIRVCGHGVPIDGICADCREQRSGVPERDGDAA